MSQATPGLQSEGAERDATTQASGADVDSFALMKGRRELIIRHGADTYRLRLTASNKLILTK